MTTSRRSWRKFVHSSQRSKIYIRPMPPNENPPPPRPARLLQNWISLTGVLFAAGSVFSFLLLFSIDLFLPHSNPYMGLLVYVVAPFCFFLGLILIFIGL